MENKEEVFLKILLGQWSLNLTSMDLKKLKNASKSGSRFSEIVKVTKKIVSSMSNTNRCYHMKLTMPFMCRKFF